MLLEVLFGVVFPVLRDRVLELLRPELLDPVEDVLLLRDPGGEDVRVAMVINVIQSHTSHRDHSERVGRGLETTGLTQKSSGETDPLRELSARAMALPREAYLGCQWVTHFTRVTAESTSEGNHT